MATFASPKGGGVEIGGGGLYFKLLEVVAVNGTVSKRVDVSP